MSDLVCAVFFPLLHRFGRHIHDWLISHMQDRHFSQTDNFRCLVFTHLDVNTSAVSNVQTRFPFLPLVWFPVSLGFLLLNSSWKKVAATLVEVFPSTTKANGPQHVANPNTSLQCTTVGLAGMHYPKQLTVHTESGEVRHRNKNTEKEKLWEERVNEYVHSLSPLWTVMSGFGELINTKHTVIEGSNDWLPSKLFMCTFDLSHL